MSSTDIAIVKKFLNNPDDFVPESLAGLAAAHPDLLRVDLENQIVVRREAPVSGKVALVSGGGSGHEPLHGGFVGKGMLDAACPGAVFTSPVPDQMLAATKAVDGGAGVVHIVKNYTGDVLNFRMAAELAEDEGIQVESVLTNDDVAVEDSLYTAGRRGVGITVLVEKIAGAKAEAGGTLAEVAGIARKVNAQGRSFGVALTSCATPSSNGPIFEIGADEMEFGVGIHGEPGRRRESIRPAAEIVEQMTTAILDDLAPSRGLERARVRERARRHAADRALPRLQRVDEAARAARSDRNAEPRRQLHHEPGDGRRLDHAARARRRADGAVGCSRAHSGVAVGHLVDGRRSERGRGHRAELARRFGGRAP